MEATKESPAVCARRTLVVEDDRIARLALTKILQSLGQEVQTASTVAEGLAKLPGGIECMLLDLMLPDGNGLEILQRVRTDKLPIRVAVTTAVDNPELLAQVDLLHPDAVFHKPLHVPDLARWLTKPANVT